MLKAILLTLSTDLTQATQVEQELYEADTGVSLFHEFFVHNLCGISFPGRKQFLKIISKVRFSRSTTTCDPAEGLILPPNGKAWLCDKPFTPTAAAKNTRCFLTCNNGFGVVQGEFDITDGALN